MSYVTVHYGHNNVRYESPSPPSLPLSLSLFLSPSLSHPLPLTLPPSPTFPPSLAIFLSHSLSLSLSLSLSHSLSLPPSLADWKQRYAALMSISSIAEGCEKQMIPILEDVVTSILPYCQDSVSALVLHVVASTGIFNTMDYMALVASSTACFQYNT